MTIILPDTTTVQPTNGCQHWCRTHDNDLDLCLAADITLDFGDRGTDGLAVHNARVSLVNVPAGTTIELAINNNDIAALDPAQATALAHALLAHVAAADGNEYTARLRRDYALENVETTVAARPITRRDRVTWTDKITGQNHTGTVEAIETWRGYPQARVDTDTDGTCKVVTTIDVDRLTRLTDTDSSPR